MGCSSVLDRQVVFLYTDTPQQIYYSTVSYGLSSHDYAQINHIKLVGFANGHLPMGVL